MVFLTKETSQDITITSKRSLLVESMEFQQKKYFLHNFRFSIKGRKSSFFNYDLF